MDLTRRAAALSGHDAQQLDRLGIGTEPDIARRRLRSSKPLGANASYLALRAIVKRVANHLPRIAPGDGFKRDLLPRYHAMERSMLEEPARQIIMALGVDETTGGWHVCFSPRVLARFRAASEADGPVNRWSICGVTVSLRTQAKGPPARSI